MKHAFAKNIHKGEDAWMQHRDLKWGGGGTTTSEGRAIETLQSSFQERCQAPQPQLRLAVPHAPPGACLQHRPQLGVSCTTGPTSVTSRLLWQQHLMMQSHHWPSERSHLLHK